MPHSRSRRPRRILKVKRLLLLVAVAGLVVATGYGLHAAQAGRQATTLLAVARAAREAGDGPKAADFYRQYLTYRDRDPAAYGELAGVYDGLSRGTPRLWNLAARAYESALNLDPKRHPDRKAAAVLYLRFGRTAAARKHLETLLQSADPTYTHDPETYELLARCDEAERDAGAAKKHYRAALDTGRAAPSAYLELATLLRGGAADGPTAAEADLLMDELVKARPIDLAARLARARYRVRAGDRLGAADDLRAAYADIPGGADDEFIVLQHAEVLAETDLPAARKVLDKARAAKPDSVPLALGTAEALRRGGAAADAAAVLREVAARRGDGDPQLLALGDRLIDLNDLDAAAALAQRCDAAAAPYLTGRVAAVRGAWPAARPLLQAALPALADRPALAVKARLALAGCAGAAGDPDGEEEQFAAALALDAANTAAKLGRAAALAKLGRTAEAAELYRGMMKAVPAAQVGLALLKFEELVRLPEADRRWSEFDSLAGPAEALEPALLIPAARAAVMQGKPAEAERLLEAALARAPDQPAGWVELAAIRSRRDRAAVFAALDKARETLGDRVELRIARAEWRASETGPPDPAAFRRLAEGTERYTPAEQAALFQGLAGVAASLGDHAESVSLLRRAAADRPFDLALRLSLFDEALRARDLATADAALAVLRELDGDAGPVATAAGFGRDLAAGVPPTPEWVAGWNPRIAAALARRGGWGRLHQIAGDVALLERRPSAALDHYLKAIDRREFAPPLVRLAVDILLDAGRTAEALALMARPDVRAAVGPALGKSFDLIRASLVFTADRTAALALARDPDLAVSPNVRDQLARADVFGVAGSIPEALDALRWAKSLDDVSPAVRVAIVRYLLAAGQPAGAVAQMQEAERRWADPAVAFENPTAVPSALGVCKELVGDLPAAAAELAKVTALTPNDPAAWQRRFDLFHRAADTAEAEKIAAEAAASNHPEVALWGRRRQALAMLDAWDGGRAERRTAASALLDRNLKDGGERPADTRAKGFVVLADPFRRGEGLQMLNRTRGAGPLTPEEAGRMAAVLGRAGDLAGADKHLTDATADGWHAAPEHLARLSVVKIKLNDTSAARLIVNRLKLVAPQAWPAAVAEAGVLVAEGQRDAALARLRGHPVARSQPLALARALEDVGAVAEADAEYAKAGPLHPYVVLAREAAAAEERGDAEAALAKWADAVKHSPPDRKADRLVALATLTVLAHPERARDALALANEAAALVGPRADVLEARALARAALKDAAAALNDLTAAAGDDSRPRFFFRIARIQDGLKNIDARNRAAARALDGGLTAADLRPLERPRFEKLKEWK